MTADEGAEAQEDSQEKLQIKAIFCLKDRETEYKSKDSVLSKIISSVSYKLYVCVGGGRGLQTLLSLCGLTLSPSHPPL